jgi:general secretion pathway protein D
MQWLRLLLCIVGLAVAVDSFELATAQEPPPAPAAPPAGAPPSPPPAPEEVPPPAAAATEPDDGKLISLDFQDVELAVLVKFISNITGKNFIIDERVKGKVTIISPGKISVDEAYAVFQSVLQVKNFTTVPSGSVIKILPAQEAKSSTVDTYLPEGRPDITDEFITKLMRLTNVDVNNVVPIIQPLVSPNGLLAAYAATNTLIIIDSAANITRVGRILHELDVAGMERGVEVMRLNYAFATEMAAILEQVLNDQAASSQPSLIPGQPRTSASSRRAQRPGAPQTPQQAAVTSGSDSQNAFKIIPDERTNALIVVAGPLEMRRIKNLVVRLDVPLPFGTGRIHVYYLKYANAFEIVPVLSDLIGGSGGGVGGLSGGLFARGLAGSTSFRGGRLGERGGLRGLGSDLGGSSSFGGSNFGSFSSGLGGLGVGSRGQGFGGSGSGSLRGGGFGGGGFGGGAGGGVSSIVGGGGGEFEGEIRITADPSTNALIINASPQDFETLKRVIEQLDVRRRQVYVEAIIMEVRLETQRALGIELQGATGLNNGVGFGRVNFGNINNAIGNPANIPGLILAAASNQTVRLPDGTVVPAQAALLTAAQGNTDVNILSAPNILTTDNQEAEIVVGQNVPFLASRSTSETNLTNTFATIERRDVGITLRLTPQISEGGMVRLEIFQEVSAIVPSAVVDANQLGPVTTIRSATTSVVVRNSQTVVIGGLISDDINNRDNSIPFIAEIPILGTFFRSSTARREKINLLIFLTPHIVLDSREHRDLSLEQRDKLRSFMEEHNFRNLRRDQLDTPSWNPDLPPDEKELEEEEEGKSDGRVKVVPEDDFIAPEEYDSSMAPPAEAPPAEPQAMAAVPHYGREIEEEPLSRYVLLASFSERGTPPPSLRSNSGLLAVSLPENSRLTRLFRKGGQYRFTSDLFEGSYQCLEAYTTAQEALLVYPEGLPVDPAKGEYLHWQELSDATSSNVSGWSMLN